MKKIGEISALYQISNRMLRYYEQRGILTSIRMENNYRFYNEFQEQRLKQILLLKELNLNTREIEEVFQTKSVLNVIKILSNKQESLQKQILELQKLDIIINNFIHLLNTCSSPIFESLMLSIENPNYKLKGENMLDNELVRIIQLPKMKVASFKCESVSPEEDVSKLVMEFVDENNLQNFRHFGFNNPNPTKESQTYGYEMWVTVEKDYKGIQMKNFNGGLYASITSKMPDIGTRWNNLVQHIQNTSEYEIDITEVDQYGVCEHQWLEECCNYSHFFNPDISFDEKQLDLLLPIKRKKK